MPTYLLTWNPDKWPWGGLAKEARAVQRGRKVAGRWSCDGTKQIKAGDRLFFMKQGKRPRGIVASGWATSNWFEDDHWDPIRKAKGKPARYVGIEFETLLDPGRYPILDRIELQRGSLASVHWGTQASGMHIPENAAGELERLWEMHIGGLGIANQPRKSRPHHAASAGWFGIEGRLVNLAAFRELELRSSDEDPDLFELVADAQRIWAGTQEVGESLYAQLIEQLDVHVIDLPASSGAGKAVGKGSAHAK